MFIDLHTHHHSNSAVAIINADTPATIGNALYSIGIHPWNISKGWEADFEKLSSRSTLKEVVAIGECGIDKTRSQANIETQKEVFKAHISLAEKAKKPLIIHCVKGADEIIALHKEMKPQQAWIIHGFRGKPQQATQFLKEGFYLSYGEKFNKESLEGTPLDRIFIESDTSHTSINEIYSAIAKARNIGIEELACAVKRNAETCNINISTAQHFT